MHIYGPLQITKLTLNFNSIAGTFGLRIYPLSYLNLTFAIRA